MSKNGISANLQGTQRRNLLTNLSWLWIQAHRPDVERLIRAEVDKRYPLKRMRNPKLVLPKSLEAA